MKGSYLYALQDGSPVNTSFRKFCEANNCDFKTVSEGTLCLVKTPGASEGYESSFLNVPKLKQFSEFEAGGAITDSLSVKQAFESI